MLTIRLIEVKMDFEDQINSVKEGFEEIKEQRESVEEVLLNMQRKIEEIANPDEKK